MSEDIPFEKKELIIIVHNPNNLPTINFHELKELQGDLKITTPAKIEKLKKSIREYGIFVPKFAWIDNGAYYIEDGHQTIKALAELEKGGYTVPPIPYVEIHAKNRKEAGEKLLMINSRFADINPETTFFKDFDIGLEFMEEIEIPEMELAFEGLDSKEITEDAVPEAPEEPVTEVGDLWYCGKHRVLCGDATKAENIEKLLNHKTPKYTLYPSSKMNISEMVNDSHHKTDKNAKHIVFFSGGKDSTAMLLLMIEKKMPIDDILCVSLGNWEWKETIDHIEKIKEKTEQLNIKFTHKIVSNLDQIVQEKGFPNQFLRWCTSMKLTEFRRHLKTNYSNGNYIEYVGISYDEKVRALRKGYKNVRFPLIEWKMTGEASLEYAKNAGYDWAGLYNKTNSVGCWCCPLQRLSSLRNLRDNHKEKWSHLLSMQRQSQQSFRLGFNSLFFLEHRFWLEDFNYITRKETKMNYMRQHSDTQITQYTKEAILKNTKESEMVLDLFGGEGTTLIVCEKLNRICYMMEEYPSNVDVTCQRFFNLTGIDPVRESDGKKWSELKSI